MIDDHERIEQLLAGYVLRSLTGDDAADADRLLSDHVPSCGACRATLDAFGRVASDLALSAEPVQPPETLLPRLRRELEPAAPRRRPIHAFAVAAGVVAVVGLAGLTVSQSMRADDAGVRADALSTALAFASRDDAELVDVGPVQEVSAPGEDRFFVMGHGVDAPPAGTVYRVWLVRSTELTYVGDFVPDDGQVIFEVPYDPAAYDDLWISIEPSDAPTDEPSSADWWAASEAPAA